MALKNILFCFIAMVISAAGFAQSDSTASDVSSQKPPSDVNYRPIFGLGVGTFNYYGELSKNERSNNPFVNNFGFEATLGMPVLSYLDVYINFFRGNLSANTTTAPYLNFSSQITAGGLNFLYNFDNVLEPDHVAEPYISVGFESVEFLSKTDLIGSGGSSYFYWDDGTLRNLPQTPENIPNAVRIQRDYTYETDLRSLNYEGQGIYREQTFAIPIGIGVNLKLHQQVKFKAGTSIHLTFTDRIDGISADGIGNRKGDGRNDRFLFTSFSLLWDFSSKPKNKGDEIELTKTDYLAIEKGDYDEDGVIDFEDDCPNTPRGLAVQENGCPSDGDKDGVPDELDQELNSAANAVVDSNGVTLTDDQIYENFMRYTGAESDNRFADTSYAMELANSRTQRARGSVRVSGGGSSGVSPQPITSSPKTPVSLKPSTSTGKVVSTQKPSGALGTEAPLSSRKLYRVQVAAVRNFIKDQRFAQVPDLVFLKYEDGIIRYFSGGFETRAEANKRKDELVKMGFKDAWVKEISGSED